MIRKDDDEELSPEETAEEVTPEETSAEPEVFPLSPAHPVSIRANAAAEAKTAVYFFFILLLLFLVTVSLSARWFCLCFYFTVPGTKNILTTG